MRRKFALLLLLALPGCGPSAESSFIGDRIPDSCGANWPVCDTFAGCRLDGESYVSGKLPGKRKFIVHSNGPATIEVSMLVTDAEAEGQSTSLTFFEPGCGVQYRVEATGAAFFAESQTESGTPFSRSQDVSNAGDHLILLDSDATANYLLKVTIAERNPAP